MTPKQKVGLTRTDFPDTDSEMLWTIIKDRSAALSFARYSAFLNAVLSGQRARPAIGSRFEIPARWP